MEISEKQREEPENKTKRCKVEVEVTNLTWMITAATSFGTERNVHIQGEEERIEQKSHSRISRGLRDCIQLLWRKHAPHRHHCLSGAALLTHSNNIKDILSDMTQIQGKKCFRAHLI